VSSYSLQVEGELDSVVGSQDKWTSQTTSQFGKDTLVHSTNTFILDDLSEAVDSTPVQTLSSGLLRVKHHPTTHSVEGVVEWSGDGTCKSSAHEGGDDTDDTLILLPWVGVHDLCEEPKLATSVDESTGDGDSGTSVEASDSSLSDGLGDAVEDSVEGLGTATNVGGQTSSGEVEGVSQNVGNTTGCTTSQELASEIFPVVSLGVVLGGVSFDEIVEGKGGTLLRGVTEAVDQVTSPEGLCTLLSGHTFETISDSLVSLLLPREDLGVGVLSLEKELHSLHGGHGGLDDGATDTTKDQINPE